MLGVLKIFLSSPGRSKWTVVACVVVASLAGGLGLAVLLPLLATFADDGAAEQSPLTDFVIRGLETLGLPATLETMIVLVIAGMLLKAVLLVLAMRHVGYVIADVATGLRSELIDNVLNVRWPYVTRMPSGLIANAVSVDATRSGAAYRLATVSLASLAQTVVYIGLAMAVSWKLALFAILLGLLIAAILGPLVSIAKKAGRKQRRRTEELTTLMTDALGNMKPLKAMGRQDHLVAFVGKKIRSLRKGLRRETVSRQTMKALQEPLLAIFIVGGFYLANVGLSVPLSSMIVMALLLERTVRCINQIQIHVQKAAILESSYWSIKRVTAEAREAREEWPGRAAPTLDRSCRLAEVTFRYGDRTILDRVSFEAPARSLTVITGASGSGKTTITDLLLGLIEPDEGQVLIDDVPLTELDLKAWRSMVGYVPQELTLFHASILTNITLGDPSIPENAVVEAVRTSGAWDFVSQLPDGVHTTVGERGSQLSGGQRQRIALARAVVLDPALLILDEVTSALDPTTEGEICRNVLELARDRTVIAVTHKELWTDAADRVYRLRSGAGGLTVCA